MSLTRAMKLINTLSLRVKFCSCTFYYDMNLNIHQWRQKKNTNTFFGSFLFGGSRAIEPLLAGLTTMQGRQVLQGPHWITIRHQLSTCTPNPYKHFRIEKRSITEFALPVCQNSRMLALVSEQLRVNTAQMKQIRRRPLGPTVYCALPTSPHLFIRSIIPLTTFKSSIRIKVKTV